MYAARTTIEAKASNRKCAFAREIARATRDSSASVGPAAILISVHGQSKPHPRKQHLQLQKQDNRKTKSRAMCSDSFCYIRGVSRNPTCDFGQLPMQLTVRWSHPHTHTARMGAGFSPHAWIGKLPLTFGCGTGGDPFQALPAYSAEFPSRLASRLECPSKSVQLSDQSNEITPSSHPRI